MLKGIIAPPAAAPAVLGSTVTSVALTGPAEFFISGSPITGSGTLDFQFNTPTLVAHGGTGMGSFAANSLLQAGLSSTAKFQSIPLTNLSSNFLDGTGRFSIPPQPAAAAAGTSFGGTAIVDFGAFPGATDATVAVVDARVGASTVIVVTIDAVASADHSADEHLADPPRVQPGDKAVGSFNVYAFTTDKYFKYGKWNVAWTGTG